MRVVEEACEERAGGRVFAGTADLDAFGADYVGQERIPADESLEELVRIAQRSKDGVG